MGSGCAQALILGLHETQAVTQPSKEDFCLGVVFQFLPGFMVDRLKSEME